MKRLKNSFEGLSNAIVSFGAIVWFSIISMATFISSTVKESAYSTTYAFIMDNPFINLIFMAVFLYIIKILGDCVIKHTTFGIKILLIGEMTFAVVGGMIFCIFSKCYPTADQSSIYYIARDFALNRFGGLQKVGSYLSVYPHQLGLVMMEEFVMRLTHSDNYHFLHGVNAICNAMTIWSLYSISNQLFENKQINVYVLLLTGSCLPLFWYTPFIYGDLPSIGLGLMGIALLLKWIKKKNSKIWKNVLFVTMSILFLIAATVVRTNSLILVLGVSLCLMVYGVTRGNARTIVISIVVFLLCINARQTVATIYEWRSGNEVNEGMPPISHVVMGMQEGSDGNGYYNGYNFDVFVNKANYDAAIAKQIAKKDFDERLKYFSENPGYAISFFAKKNALQWLSADYECLFFTSGSYEGRPEVIESLYSGSLYKLTSFYMDKYAFCIYSFAAFAIAIMYYTKRKKNTTILHSILLSIIIGGAIFHTIWEGSGRYILPYFVYTIPYTAYGMAMMIRRVRFCIWKFHK